MNLNQISIGDPYSYETEQYQRRLLKEEIKNEILEELRNDVEVLKEKVKTDEWAARCVERVGWYHVEIKCDCCGEVVAIVDTSIDQPLSFACPECFLLIKSIEGIKQ